MEKKVFKQLGVVVFIVFCFNGFFAQQYDFNIEKPKIKLSITPNYKFLFRNAIHPISVKVNSDSLSYTIEFAGGEVNKTDTGTFITPLVEGEVLLNIKDANGRLLASKSYIVKPEPVLMLAGATTDTVLTDFILVSNRIYAKSKGWPPFRVKSFSLDFGGSISDVKGDKIPGPMKIRLFDLPNMTFVTYSDVRIELFKDVFVYLKPFRVSMLKTKTRDVTRFQLD